MKLSELVRHVQIEAVHGPLDRGVDVDVDHVTRDSRDVRSGSVFVAVVGARVDGHDFAGLVDGAAVVVERRVEMSTDVNVLRVSDSKRALAQIAAALNDHPSRSLSVVGVTGTNGKTTLTSMVEGALLHLGRPVGRIGTTGVALNGVLRPSAFTTPEAPRLQGLLAELRDAGAAVVTLEVSSIGLSQRRVDEIGFHTAVFTNLTRDHLDFHGSMEAYKQAKVRLFAELLRPPGGSPRAILCGDDPHHGSMGAPPDRWTYGFDALNDVAIEGLEASASGLRFGVRTPEGKVQVHSSLLGDHNALNLTGALAVLRCLEVSWETAAEALGEVRCVPGRLERVPDPAGRLVVVDYAHSPDALQSTLRVLRPITSGALWVVFGCGGDRDRGKRPEMGAVAHALADRVVVTSDNPRSESPRDIVDAIVGGLPVDGQVHVEVDRAQAITWALARAGSGDTVLIAGKGHETSQEIAGVKHPFDDRAVACAALEGA